MSECALLHLCLWQVAGVLAAGMPYAFAPCAYAHPPRGYCATWPGHAATGRAAGQNAQAINGTLRRGLRPGGWGTRVLFRTRDRGYVERCMSTVVLPAVKNLMYCTRGVAAIARTLRHQFPLPLSRPPADVTPLIQYHHEAARIAQRCNVRCCGSISSRAIPAHSVHCRR